MRRNFEKFGVSGIWRGRLYGTVSFAVVNIPIIQQWQTGPPRTLQVRLNVQALCTVGYICWLARWTKYPPNHHYPMISLILFGWNFPLWTMKNANKIQQNDNQILMSVIFLTQFIRKTPEFPESIGLCFNIGFMHILFPFFDVLFHHITSLSKFERSDLSLKGHERKYLI